MFQFHMVRLKGEQPIYNKELFFGFQFHMVRLKVSDLDNENLVKVFQFHMVRLKGVKI